MHTKQHRLDSPSAAPQFRNSTDPAVFVVWGINQKDSLGPHSTAIYGHKTLGLILTVVVSATQGLWRMGRMWSGLEDGNKTRELR